VESASTENHRPLRDIIAEMYRLDDEAREIDTKLAKLIKDVGAPQ
jgi:hypothetical protein